MDAKAMLAGPRGRRLCLEYAAAMEPCIRAAVSDAEPHRLSGTLWVGAEGVLAERPPHAPADLVALLGSLDLTHVDEEEVRAALRWSVGSAMYWEAPDDWDKVAARPEVSAALGRVAEAILSSSPASGWDSARADDQWDVDFWLDGVDGSPLPLDPAARLAEWDRSQRDEERRAQLERPRDPRANYSGHWWSVPPWILTTRGNLAYALELVEDGVGWERATAIPMRGAGRTHEIASAHDWAELCRAYPLEVTASRRHDWFRVAGRDGRWLIPDWRRVSEDWDAVHLTTFAYLCAATTLIEIDSEYATVIGGWAPDSTLWLSDVARESGRPREQWVRSGSDEWIRED